MVLKFTANTVLSYHGQPVLMDGDLCAGPFLGADKPPHCSDTAERIVRRFLAGEARPDDPAITADPPEMVHDFAWRYLGISEEQIENARLLTKIAERIKNEKAGRPARN
jgi:hypothetical protein